MQPPVLTWITATNLVPRPDLMHRIALLADLPQHVRSRVAIQLRDPTLSTKDLYTLGEALRDLTRQVGISLVVNDRLDVAKLLQADGVHLGRRSVDVADARAFLGQSVFVSVSCHDVDDVVRAVERGADAALLSPIFASPGKSEPLGLAALTEAKARLRALDCNLALIALGGVDSTLAQACMAAGANGVAAIRADLTAVLFELVTMRTDDAPQSQ